MLYSGENNGSVCRQFRLNLGWEDPERTLKTLGERLKSGGGGENRRLSTIFYVYLGGTCSPRQHHCSRAYRESSAPVNR